MFFSRGLNKIQHPLGIKHTYKSYSDSIEKDSIYDVGYKKYMEICTKFYSRVSKEILKGNRFKLPLSLGEIYVVKKKVDLSKERSIPKDWKKTSELGKVIFNLNRHTRGFVYKFYWKKDRSNVPNLFLYKFIPCRGDAKIGYGKRGLANVIKSGNTDFFEK
jgi:hypothetical protein